MATQAVEQRKLKRAEGNKVHVPLRLPPQLVEYVDAKASRQFTSRNEIIQGLIVADFLAADSTDGKSALTPAKG